MPVERAEFGWQVVDASGWSPASLGQAVEAAVRYSFDLAVEIPLRARLFRLPRMSMCWWRWCIISPLMVGRSPRWCAI
ncbi:linear gramicidin synthetase subunit D domain protein [Mycobacterium xenopi 4042]|uniref:Linear gramicidin synthetase subunit D domain protein n=1 Tax=Mycobacterium xenopi 4042 TaxID=1299334 RepID=X8ALZ5_MYCXE|nr:linear gramicidin synthetase subunit D domain protein [Mycobacterium xenopi 4042]